MVEFFLDYSADLNKLSEYRETPLNLALPKDVLGQITVMPGKTTSGELRLCWTSSPRNHDKYRTAQEEVAQRRVNLIDPLLSRTETDIEAQDSKGASTLHCIPYGKPESPHIVSGWIKKGASIAALDSRKQTALHLASLEGNSSSVSLLSSSANISVAHKDGLIPLHCAAMSGSIETIREVLRTCDTFIVNLSSARDNKGQNALHHLLSRHRIDNIVVRVLLAKHSERIRTAWMPLRLCLRYLQWWHNRTSRWL